MAETKEVPFPIAFAYDMERGPDGKFWVTMIVAANFAQFTVMFPVEMAEAMMVQLPQALKDIVTKCKQAEGQSLVIAGANTLSTLKEARHGQ